MILPMSETKTSESTHRYLGAHNVYYVKLDIGLSFDLSGLLIMRRTSLSSPYPSVRINPKLRLVNEPVHRQ